MAPKPKIIAAGREGRWRKRRAAALLGVSRPTFDLWLRRQSIDWPRGVDDARRIDALNRLYPADVKHTSNDSKPLEQNHVTIRLVGPTFGGVSDTSTVEVTREDLRLPVSIRVRESLWRQIRHVALDRGVPAADLAEEALSDWLTKARPEASPKAEQPKRKAKDSAK